MMFVNAKFARSNSQISTNEVLMNTKQKHNWWIDFVLFAGFITTFFLDLTGVEAHQWIGIFGGALAAYHLLLHLDWVEAVSKRFFTKTSGQARLYYVTDALLLLGFVLIGVTGLVISTWLNLSLSNFAAWLNIHITISIATLMILLLKLVFHWRWIVRTTRKIWAEPVMKPARNPAVQPAKVSSGHMGRREFLQVMCIVGAASFLALANASKSLAKTVASIETFATDEVDTAETTVTEDNNTQSNSNSVTSSNRSSSSSSSSSRCTARCRKNCSYPGHCHDYVDVNNNGRCDLGECV
jgi:hypothetical protein